MGLKSKFKMILKRVKKYLTVWPTDVYPQYMLLYKKLY